MRHCVICGAEIILRQGEYLCAFKKRQTCGMEHKRALLRRIHLGQIPGNYARVGRPEVSAVQREQFSGSIESIMRACLLRIGWRGEIWTLDDWWQAFWMSGKKSERRRLLQQVTHAALNQSSRINTDVRFGPRSMSR